jgi:succinoglycan biosynthesis transport protein ExoP
VDVRTTTDFIDSYVFVVQWGRTKIDVVEHALRNAPGVNDNLLGVALNKTNMRALARYDNYRGGYYSNRDFGRYGYSD